MQHKTYFDKLLDKIKELPLWIKQALLAELKEHVNELAPFITIDTISKHNLVQLYVPGITSSGKKLINDPQDALRDIIIPYSVDMIAMLNDANQKLKIMDICSKENWTLSKCSGILTDCIEHNLIEHITSTYISSTIYFLAGKIRIGEYLVRTGKITVDQLDMALYSQKYTQESMGDRIFLAQILLNLRYITPEDYENIIFLKDYGDELYSAELNENIHDVEDFVDNLKKELDVLKKERLKLRDNLSKISDDAQTIAALLDKIDTLKVNLTKMQSEKDKAQKDLQLYLDEIMAMSQENIELREKLQQ